MKRILFLIMCLFALPSMGQTTLSPGDLVILEFNGNGTDGFTFMPLVDMSAGTTVHFTDYGWSGTAFLTGEDGTMVPPGGQGNMITYTATSPIVAGTLIRQNTANIGGSAFTATSGWGFNFDNLNYIYSISSTSSGHDGLIVFQGTYDSPRFIWAYHTGQWGQGSYANYYWSNLPSTLTNGTNAVFFQDLASGTDITVDDGYYSGPTTATTAAVWRSRVANSANWTTSASGTAPTLLYPNTYTVTSNSVAPMVTTQAVSSIASTSATGNGNITSLGSPNPTAHGVCWNTTGTPTVSDSKVDNGAIASTGAFTAAMTSLVENRTYYVRAYATNTAGTAYGTEVSFTTSAVNHAPTDIALSASSIDENVPADSTVGTLSSTDPDAGSTFTYTLVAGTGAADNASFSISGSSLRISSSPDYEAKSSYSVRIRTTDPDSLWCEEVFTISINDIAETPPVTLGPGDIVILEFNGNGADGFTFMPLVDLSAGTTIHFTDYGWDGTAFLTGEEGAVIPPGGDGNMITYTAPSAITAGTLIRQDSSNTGGSAFTPTAGWTYNSNGVNYIYRISSTITGHDGLTAFQGSYAAPMFIWAYHTGQWGQGSFSNYYWSNLPSTLTDGTNAIHFSDLASGEDLTVDDGYYSGPTTATTAADWRSRVANSANWTTSTDAAPALLYPNSYTIASGAVAPTVTTQAASSIAATSATGNGNITSLGSPYPTAHGVCWNITGTPTVSDSKADNGAIASTGAFTAAMTSLVENRTYYVRAYATNTAGTAYGTEVSFTTSAINHAPTDIALSANSINENVAVNSTVGTLSSTDPDIGNTFTYALVAGTGDTDNASFNITSSSLRITNSPDFETKSSYSVRIRTADPGGLTFEKVFTITINDSTESPTTQAAALIFSNTSRFQMDLAWTNGNGARRAVFMAEADSGNAAPVDGATYAAGATFHAGTQIGTSGWFCVYDGTGSSVTVTGLTNNKPYRVMVCEYNGASGSEIYNITGGTTGNPANQATTRGTVKLCP